MIKKVKISNYRSIKKITVNFLPYMVFVGKNNSGKSNIMKALDIFFTDSAEINDFRKEDGRLVKKLFIVIYFSNLNKREKVLYEGKLLNESEENELLVLRYTATLSSESDKISSKKYEYVTRTLNLESQDYKDKFGGLFDDEIYKSKSKIENCNNIPANFKQSVLDSINKKSSGRIAKSEYISLRSEYIKELIRKYPRLSKLKYEPIKIGKTSLNKYLGNFFFIPAVQDVEEETRYTARGKKNLNSLMNYVLDQMQNPERKKEKEEEIQKIIKEIYHIGEKSSEIYELEQVLNEQLQTFDNSKLSFDAELPDLSKLIRDSLKIYIDDGISTEVYYKGHGLQRYFMVILFKVWSEKLPELRLKKEKEKEERETVGEYEVEPVPMSTYFAIEEPELFLHPQYQRMMLNYLQRIAEDEGHQVILNTHSPHFIEFNSMLQVAKVYKRNLEENTKVIQPLEYNKDGTIKEKEFVYSWGRPVLREKFRNINLVNMNYYLNPNRNEMFFADKVILVEGQTEKMLFQSWANYFFGDDIALISQISYIDCLGKFNMQQYLKILGEFEIPFIVVVDSDKDKSLKTQDVNKYLKKEALQRKGSYFELDPDFEGAFDIKVEEFDDELMKKKHKPFYAFTQFFGAGGEPKDPELEKLKSNNNLKTIFHAIYDKNL